MKTSKKLRLRREAVVFTAIALILIIAVTAFLISCLSGKDDSPKTKHPVASDTTTTSVTTAVSEVTSTTAASVTASSASSTVSGTNASETTAAVPENTDDPPSVSPVPDSPSDIPSDTSAQPSEASENSSSYNFPAPASPQIDGITYIDGIMMVNKTYSLPSGYNPGLDPDAENAFYTLSSDAAAQGLNIWLASGFRSYDYQYQIYNNYIAAYGQEYTDTMSARPGHSEHQTGLAIDVNSIDDTFAGTPEAIWLENHAHEYGFIIRYPKGKDAITGYKYEPWHIRYIGTEKATMIYNSGLTLEEYYNITSAYQN